MLLQVLLMISLTLSTVGCHCFSKSRSSSPEQMSLFIYDMGGSFLTTSGFRTMAARNNQIETWQVKVDQIEFKSTSGNYVTIYSGGQYIDFKAAAGSGVAGILTFTPPPAGKYSGFQLTTNGFKVKAKLQKGKEEYYYTTNQTINAGEDFPLTMDIQDWGLTSVQKGSEQWSADFINPIVVTTNQAANIALMILKDYNTVYVGNRELRYRRVHYNQPERAFPSNSTGQGRQSC